MQQPHNVRPCIAPGEQGDNVHDTDRECTRTIIIIRVRVYSISVKDNTAQRLHVLCIIRIIILLCIIHPCIIEEFSTRTSIYTCIGTIAGGSRGWSPPRIE